MSDRDISNCGLCGGTYDRNRGDGNEYSGSYARGCPSCGMTLSPVVSVKDGMVHHNGHPVTSGMGRTQDPSAGSFVIPRDGGYQAGHYSAGDGRTLITGTGKTPKAAAEDAAAKDASLLGRQFVKRPAKTEAAIRKEQRASGEY